MSIDTKKGIPGVPLAALDAIQDENARQVIRAIVDGWHVRNGSTGDGKSRFVTAAELGDLSGTVGGIRRSLSALENQTVALSASDISRIITDLQASVMESVLFKELGDRIQLIDLSVVDEQTARIAAVQQVANDLAAEAATRLGFDIAQGSQISSLQTTTATQATQISGLTTRVGSAESTIISLQSTTASQATSLSSLTTRVGSAESNITSLQTTTASQATSLSSLTTRVGSAESKISTLQTTTANTASSLTALTTRVGNTETGITAEQTARANADNAITTSVNTQFATVNGNISALQTQQTTTANNVAALSSTVTTLQASVGTNTTAIQTEATARVNADNDIYSKYSVKIDTNGYVSGFGLISTANNSTPYSDFIVRANRFAIGSPSGPGITPKVPFVVLTTTDSEGNAPGVYIDSAIIKNAAIGTLKLDGEAVFVSRWATGNGGNTYSSTRVAIVTLNLPIAGLATGETAPMIVQGYSNYSPIDGSGASVYIDISVNDTIITPSFGVSVFGDATFSGNSAQVNLPNGTHVVKLLIKIDSPGVSSKYLNVNAVLIAMSGKR